MHWGIAVLALLLRLFGGLWELFLMLRKVSCAKAYVFQLGTGGIVCCFGLAFVVEEGCGRVRACIVSYLGEFTSVGLEDRVGRWGKLR